MMFYDVLRLKIILGFLLSERTSGVSPVIFKKLYDSQQHDDDSDKKESNAKQTGFGKKVWQQAFQCKFSQRRGSDKKVDTKSSSRDAPHVLIEI